MKEYELFKKLAQDDLKLVEKNINDEEISQELLLFHLQQCTEKILKSLLSYNEIIFPKTHDIEDLVEIANENKINLPEYIGELEELTPYAVDFRYNIYDGETVNSNDYYKKVKTLLNWLHTQF